MRLKQRRHTKKTELVEADEGKSTKEKKVCRRRREALAGNYSFHKRGEKKRQQREDKIYRQLI